jgi:bis(5'-nucleosidyl)-tetraphosphatase
MEKFMVSYDEKSCGAVIFKREKGQIVYLTVEYKIEKGYWGLTKGHVEPGETELETAGREIYEEVGLKDLTFFNGFRTEISYQPKPDVTKLVVFFLAQAHNDRVEYHFNEHVDHRWLPYDEIIAQLTYDHDREVVIQAAKFLGDR